MELWERLVLALFIVLLFYLIYRDYVTYKKLNENIIKYCSTANH